MKKGLFHSEYSPFFINIGMLLIPFLTVSVVTALIIFQIFQ